MTTTFFAISMALCCTAKAVAEVDVDAELREAAAELNDIVFAVRQGSGEYHYYASFGYWSKDPRLWNTSAVKSIWKGKERKTWGVQGRLCRLNLETQKLTLLVDDPKGTVRDPHVHYDGRKILFSYRPGNTEWHHLYEINADGTGLKQLTNGPWDDIEPIYLPDGDIVFVSSRCRRWVPCAYSQVATV